MKDQQDQPPPLEDSDGEAGEMEAEETYRMPVVQQVRYTEAKCAHKKRVSLVHRAAFHGVCQGCTASRPRQRGYQEKLVLVIPGKHCCSPLETQNEHGVDVWNRDWDYECMVKYKNYIKGHPCGM